MEKFKGTYRIPSARYPLHNYNEGTYFITICSHERRHHFGKITGGEMYLSKLGKHVEHCITQIPVINSDVILHSFVVMPNHVHLVISVCRTVETSHCGVSENIRTAHSLRHPDMTHLQECPNGTLIETPHCDVSTKLPNGGPIETPHCDVSTKMKTIASSCGRLSHIISKMKSAVTKYAKAECIPFCWQSRFHDHIIRDHSEFQEIMHYVVTNVKHWEKDCNFSNPS